jgi:hypothetical protein
MDEGEPVRWKGKTYMAKPCPEVPGYYYLTDPEGHRFFVPESEFDKHIDPLVPLVEWIHAKRNSK